MDRKELKDEFMPFSPCGKQKLKRSLEFQNLVFHGRINSVLEDLEISILEITILQIAEHFLTP